MKKRKYLSKTHSYGLAIAMGCSALLYQGVNHSWANEEQSNNAQDDEVVSLNFNLNTKHAVDLFDSFDRRRFITLHSTHTEGDWFGDNDVSLNAPNEDPDLMSNFLDGYDVYFGRDTGAMAYQLNQLPEDPTRPGYADPTTADENGGGVKWSYTSPTDANSVEMRSHADRNTELIVGAQQHPYWPNGQLIPGQSWAFSQADTTDEPIGTATGDYMSQFVAKYFQETPTDPYGQAKPYYVEVMNEPLFELVDYPAAGETPPTVTDVFRFHNSVADQIRQDNPDVLIGGYTVAFPDYEKGTAIFDNWKERDQLFLDIAGDNMDFISMHLYDFPNIPGSSGVELEQYRKGSNMEATLDMIEQYMAYKWGEIKPIVVSEYGSQLQGSFNEPWSPERDWLILKATNSMLVQFLERPNRIEKAIPFIPLKAEWGRVSDTVPYYWRLLRQAKEGEGETGEQWVYTELVKFYQLWADVQGTRIDTWSSDLDIQTNAYVDGQDAYLIINSLNDTPTTLDLKTYGISESNLTTAEIRHLYPDETGAPVFDDYTVTSLPEQIVIGSEGTLIIKVSYSSNVVIDEINQETKHYASSELTDIVAGQAASFSINDIEKGTYGEATLRIGIGREFSSSLTPTVNFNGTPLTVPTDYRGYDQYNEGLGRERFFGVLEIPVPYELLQADNTISVQFSDTGGAISSVTLRNFNHSAPVSRN